MTDISNHVVRKPERLPKSRVKALIADGLQKAVSVHGVERVAHAGGCSERAVQKALAHETLIGLDSLADMLDADPHILDALLAAKGFAPLTRAVGKPANDMLLATDLSGALSVILHRLSDGVRCHVDTAVFADLFRALIPQMQAIVNEDDVRKGRIAA